MQNIENIENVVNWVPLSDALTEEEVTLELEWSADSRTEAAIKRQARIEGYESPTDYLVNILAVGIASDETDSIVVDDGRILPGHLGIDRQGRGQPV